MIRTKKIKDNLRSIRKHSFFKDFSVIALDIFLLILLLVLFFIIFLGVKPSNLLVQLRFDSLSGVTRTGPWYALYNIFIVGIVIYLINNFLAYFFYKQERLISVFLLIGTLISEVILIIEAINFIKLINM